MTTTEKPDIVIVSSKGQVVIPQGIRKKLGINPESKLLVYRYQDAVIMKKIKVPDRVKELEQLYKKIDAKIPMYGELSEEEINAIVQKYRRQK
nr:AbrB/MazE/SpoVT family DNA-binding domain-containing protein [Candidatus Njordarchaeota archaeon]